MKVIGIPIQLETKGELAILFLGAGASKTFGILTTLEMAKEFGQGLGYPEKDLFNRIVNKLKNYRNFDIEALITVLERIGNIARAMFDLRSRPVDIAFRIYKLILGDTVNNNFNQVVKKFDWESIVLTRLVPLLC